MMKANPVHRKQLAAGFACAALLFAGACSDETAAFREDEAFALTLQESANTIALHRPNQATEVFPNMSNGARADIETLYAYAYRGFYGEPETPSFLKDLLQAAADERDSSAYTYIRLINEPQIPKEAENWTGYKDLLICADPVHPEDAVLAVQNPVAQDEWIAYQVPGYGQWLRSEIELALFHL